MVSHHEHFDLLEAIEYGWNATKKHIGFFVVLLLLIWLMDAAVNKLFPHFIVGFIVQILIIMGLVHVALRIHDHKKVAFEDFFLAFKGKVLDYLGAAVIYHLLVAFGLLLFVVPGIVWAIQYKFYGYFIVDKKMGALNALQASADLTKGVKWDLFWFNVILFLILFGGLLLLAVGLLVAVPVVMLATAFVYRELLKHHKK
jgi:uncharacterized membrane protein